MRGRVAVFNSYPMFSWKSSANLKIVGAEGHSPQSLRDEVARGAKFVFFTYSISLLVVSFKRPTSVYFIPAGHSPLMKGLPFTLVSVLFGWWGFPWGIIYTLQALHLNLGGGTDVTTEILAGLAPPPLIAGGTPATRPPLPAAPTPYSARRILGSVGVLAAVAAIVYPIVCFVAGRNFPVALVSGLSTPYSLTLNGKSYQLMPHRPVLLTLAEGNFYIRDALAVGPDQDFTIRSPFFTRPFNRQVLVINPDRAAVVYRESIRYHPTGTPTDPNEKADYFLSVNNVAHVFPKPDYFFEEYPENISMPSGSSGVSKSRVAVFNGLTVDTLFPMIKERVGYDAARDYLAIQAKFSPENESLQRIIYAQLKHDDARKLFESHLTDRPVLVEWHRAYQFFMDTFYPTVDLTTRYRRWMEAEPDDGTLTYLYARRLHNPVASQPLYEQALHAKRPSAWAAYALGTDAFASGRYTESLKFLQQAEGAGLRSDSLSLRLRDTLLALGRFDDAIARLHQQRAHDPTDTELFTDELMLTQSQHPNRAGGMSAISAFMAAVRRKYGSTADYQPLTQYVTSHLAYSLGDEAAFGAAKVTGPVNLFEAALSRRDLAAANRAVASEGELPARYDWLMMLAAHAAGDAAAEEKYYAAAVAALGKADSDSREVVRCLMANTPASHVKILQMPDYADDLRIMFTALGLRFPAQRELYFTRARELDHDPAFPHLLLKAVRRDFLIKGTAPKPS